MRKAIIHPKLGLIAFILHIAQITFCFKIGYSIKWSTNFLSDVIIIQHINKVKAEYS
jgi:hypothetical protein